MQISLTYINFLSFSPFLGSTFICNTHIIPVKNQEGVAMMFIINFEYVTDDENAESLEKFNPILPARLVNRKWGVSGGGKGRESNHILLLFSLQNSFIHIIISDIMN